MRKVSFCRLRVSADKLHTCVVYRSSKSNKILVYPRLVVVAKSDVSASTSRLSDVGQVRMEVRLWQVVRDPRTKALWKSRKWQRKQFGIVQSRNLHNPAEKSNLGRKQMLSGAP